MAPSRAGAGSGRGRDRVPPPNGAGLPLLCRRDPPASASATPRPRRGRTTALFVGEIDARALVFEKNGERFESEVDVLVVARPRTGEGSPAEHEIDLSFPPPSSSGSGSRTSPDARRRTAARPAPGAPPGPGDQLGRLGTVGHELEVPSARPSASRPRSSLTSSTPAAARPPDPWLDGPSSETERSPSYQVHGAEGSRGPGTGGRRVRVESASGTVVARGADAELAPGPDGCLSQMAAIDSPTIPPGRYAAVVSARDEVAGETVGTRVQFRVAPRPGTVAGGGGGPGVRR